MKRIVVLLFLIAVLHFGANIFGVYDMQIRAGFVWFDNVLHLLVGIVFGLFWLSLVQDRLREKGKSFWYIAATTVLFVFAMALVWEVGEFFFLTIVPAVAHNLNIYSTSVQEAVADMLSNIVGVGLLLVWCRMQLTRKGSE